MDSQRQEGGLTRTRQFGSNGMASGGPLAVWASMPTRAAGDGGDPAGERGGPGSMLILDNAEHVAEDLAALVVHLLAGTVDLSILVTSRRRLRIDGEAVLLLRPLGVPLPSDDLEAIGTVAAARCADIGPAALARNLDRTHGPRGDRQTTW